MLESEGNAAWKATHALVGDYWPRPNARAQRLLRRGVSCPRWHAMKLGVAQIVLRGVEELGRKYKYTVRFQQTGADSVGPRLNRCERHSRHDVSATAKTIIFVMRFGRAALRGFGLRICDQGIRSGSPGNCRYLRRVAGAQAGYSHVHEGPR